MPVSDVVVLVGPGNVRAWRDGAEVPPPQKVPAALANIDDDVCFLDGRPVAVAAVWREVFEMVAGSDVGTLTLVCPSWWSAHRIAVVSDAARTVAADVAVTRRREALAVASGARPSIVVEIAGSLIALSRPSDSRPAGVVTRDGVEVAAIAETAARGVAALDLREGPAIIDRADGVPGAAALAALIARELRATGLAVAVVGDDRLAPTVSPRRECAEAPSRRHVSARVLTLTGGGVVAAVIAAVAVTSDHSSPAPSPVTVLVEGRIAVTVPASWSEQRILAGPGSARLQVTSPTEPDTAIHITQSPVPRGLTLTDVAATLEAAIRDESPNEFVDFNPHDRPADRPAVTYREVRRGHDIRWAVWVDGSVRISIGCQSARGREETAREPCERAITSARELTGTNPPRQQSNHT